MFGFLYIFLIGVLSLLTSALIFICLNGSPSKERSQNPRSPLEEKSISEKQKRMILFLVFGIFFVAMFSSSYKSGKFHYWFSGCATQQIVAKVKSISILAPKQENSCFLGFNGEDCELASIQSQQGAAQTFFSNIQSDLLGLLFKVRQRTPLGENQLSIYNLDPQYKIKESHFLKGIPLQLCKQSALGDSQQNTPVVFLNLQEQQLLFESMLRKRSSTVATYSNFRAHVCAQNGIEIAKETLFNGEVYQTFQDVAPENPKNSILVINNFEHLLNSLIEVPTYSKSESTLNNFQESHDSQSRQNLFGIFLEKMFNELIGKCRLNVILLTSDSASIKKLQNRWNLYNGQAEKEQAEIGFFSKYRYEKFSRFPFIVKDLPKATIKDFQDIISVRAKQWDSDLLPEQEALKHLESYYKSNKKKFAADTEINLPETTSYIQNLREHYESLEQKKQSEESDSVKRQKQPYYKNTHRSYGTHSEEMLTVAKFNGLQKPYQKLRNLHSPMLSYAKREISYEQMMALQNLGLLKIDGGRISLK